MRLTNLEVASIIQVLTELIPAEFSGRLLLFGSRVLDNAKGGDIDLALIGVDRSQILSLKKVDFKILAALKMNPHIGDRKIDLKILSVEDTQSAFFQHALRNAVELKLW